MIRSALRGVGISAALALLLPAAAQSEEGQRPLVTGFRLQASNGYKLIALAAPGDGGGKGGSLALIAAGTHDAVTYSTPATVSHTAIDADLGKLGEISVTRVPTGHEKTVRSGCKRGDKRRVEAERYEGAIEFHGEEGFTDLSATSAPFEYPNICGAEEGVRNPGKTLPGARLDVDKNRPRHDRLEFSAIQNRPGARTRVHAEIDEHRGAMEINRATFTWASAGALRFDRGLHAATVKPPAPFSGYGIFHGNGREATANRWTGNLTVDFPGHSDVAITGQGFSAILERPRR